MAKLYHTSFLENHRLNLTFTLLQTEEIDILSDFTDQDYQQVGFTCGGKFYGMPTKFFHVTVFFSI